MSNQGWRSAWRTFLPFAAAAQFALRLRGLWNEGADNGHSLRYVEALNGYHFHRRQHLEDTDYEVFSGL